MTSYRLLSRAGATAFLSALILSLAPACFPQAQGAQAGRQGATQARGALQGKVVDDAGLPLANIIVRATIPADPKARSYATSTDEAGVFRFEDVPVTSYLFQVTTLDHYYGDFAAPPKYYRPGEPALLQLRRGSVITGAVTNAAGESVIAVAVRAIKVRDLEGRPMRLPRVMMTRATDDRGIYRIFGLEPGVYLINAGGSASVFGGADQGSQGYGDDCVTYHPSAPSASTASEVIVGRMSEVTGIDIRYRAEEGRSISGTVSGLPVNVLFGGGAAVYLINPATSSVEAFVSPRARGQAASMPYSITGLADGDYYLLAMRSPRPGEDGQVSDARRVTIKGADLSGVDLQLAPLASLAGKVLVDASSPAATCPEDDGKAGAGKKERPERLRPEDLVISARVEGKDDVKQRPPFASLLARSAIPDAAGQFVLRHVTPGKWRFEMAFPGDEWYVSSVTMTPQPAAALAAATKADEAKPVDLASSGVEVRRGERITGITITLSAGAARIQGRVTFDRQPAAGERLRVHLVPADERSTAPDYAEARVEADGSFTLRNIKPGRYRAIALISRGEEWADSSARPLVWEPKQLAKLRREAEREGEPLDLKPCQRLDGYTLRFPARSASRQ